MNEWLRKVVRRVAGHGWMYHVPWYYQRVIDRYFGTIRHQAYSELLAKLRSQTSCKTCIDIACGTGITSIWLARQLPAVSVIGVDCNKHMLDAARRSARKNGVDDRCTFVEHDARTVTREALPLDRPVDVVVCSLGYSVMPDWQATFVNTLDLLVQDGTYIIFDQYINGLYVPDFAADQSRRSWELVESNFQESATTWYGECFLSVGTNRIR